MPLDCGIDIGSTNLKVVLVNEDGRAVHVRSIPAPRKNDGIGPVTDGLELVEQLEGLIIEGWRQCGKGKPIRSIAAAGVGEDGLGVDAELRPVGLSIPWFDRRAAIEAAALETRGDSSARTGIAIGADRTAAKWSWLRKHRPDELDRAKYWVALTDFPAVWWSGRPFMSASLAPRTACFDLIRRDWMIDLLNVAGAPPLPEILGAGVTAGAVRIGPLRESGAASAKTVVAAGGHDHPVAASVIRRLDPVGIVDSLGTANLLYGELPRSGALPRSPGLAFSLPPAGGEMLSCLGVLELSAALEKVRERGGAFWDFLMQRRFPGGPPGDPQPATAESGSFRRAFEDVTFRARMLLEGMHGIGVATGPIYTNGGWSRSVGFAELRASIFGQPVNLVKDMEVTAIGAALFAAQAASGQAQCPLRPQDISVIEPVAAWAAAYRELFEASRGESRRGTLRGDTK